MQPSSPKSTPKETGPPAQVKSPKSPGAIRKKALPSHLQPPNRFQVPDWMGPPEMSCCLKVIRHQRLINVIQFTRRGYLLFGRDPGAVNVFVGHHSVARQHAYICFDNETRFAFVTDMETEMGTFVDGKLVGANKPHPLQIGSVIAFGKSVRQYIFDNQLAQAMEELHSVRKPPTPTALPPPSRPAPPPPPEGEPSPRAERKRPKLERSEDFPELVRARHLLVKHRESRNPRSKRKGEITISKDEARRRLRDYRERIIGDEKKDFGEMAREHSDCSSAKHGGDLGEFGRGTMHPAFEETAFRLKVNEISSIIDTDSGLHIIQRTA